MNGHVGLVHSKSEVLRGVSRSITCTATYTEQNRPTHITKLKKEPILYSHMSCKTAITHSSLPCEILNHATSLKDTDFTYQHWAEEHIGKIVAQGYWTANCWCQESFLPSPFPSVARCWLFRFREVQHRDFPLHSWLTNWGLELGEDWRFNSSLWCCPA